MNVITPAPFTETIAIRHIKCGECGVNFGLDAKFQEARLKDRHKFRCPNGCEISYLGETEAERLRKQLETTERCLANTRESLTHMGARARSAERSVQARKGVVTRMKRRLIAGRCVCCSQQFKDLKKHMKEEHPKYDPERAAEAIASKAAPK